MATTKTSQQIQRNILTSFISDSGKISFLRTRVLWMSIPSIQNPPLFLYTVLVPQLCLILCDSVDCNSPGSSVHGISQARILEWVTVLFSRGSSWPGIKPRSPIFPWDSAFPYSQSTPYYGWGWHILSWKSKDVMKDSDTLHDSWSWPGSV